MRRNYLVSATRDGITLARLYGGEGGLRPQPFGNPRFTREIAAIPFPVAGFQIQG
jgi:hypothetical protein